MLKYISVYHSCAGLLVGSILGAHATRPLHQAGSCHVAGAAQPAMQAAMQGPPFCSCCTAQRFSPAQWAKSRPTSALWSFYRLLWSAGGGHAALQDDMQGQLLGIATPLSIYYLGIGPYIDASWLLSSVMALKFPVPVYRHMNALRRSGREVMPQQEL